MLDDRTKLLADTVRKLYHRDALPNIRKILAKSHTADIAVVLETFDLQDRLRIFKLEPLAESRAQILSYLPKDQQIEMVQSLPAQEVRDLVSLMDTDDAADLLNHLPEDETNKILSSVSRETSEEVADLMVYEDDSAGGLMSSEYIALDQELTVDAAVRVLQDEEKETRVPFYLYVVDENEKLLGVISLKHLLLSHKNEKLKELMNTEVVSVNVNTKQQDVAAIVERYDFLAIPVVEESHRLVGVITVDDVIDVIREEAEEELLSAGQAGLDWDVSTKEHLQARLPWLLLSFLGGSLAFSSVYLLGFFKVIEQPPLIWMVAAFVPLLLALGSTTGSQAATVAVGAIRSGRIELRKHIEHLLKELRIGLVLSFVFGLLILGVSELVMGQGHLSLLFTLVTMVHIFMSLTFGSLIPFMLHKLNLDFTSSSVPVMTAAGNISGVVLLFSAFQMWIG